MDHRFELRLKRVRLVAAAGLGLLAAAPSSADGERLAPGGALDPAYPNAEIDLDEPRVQTLPGGAACGVGERYVDLVNARRYAEFDDLQAEDVMFLESAQRGDQDGSQRPCAEISPCS